MRCLLLNLAAVVVLLSFSVGAEVAASEASSKVCQLIPADGKVGSLDGWKSFTNVKKSAAVEKPTGEWNHYRIIAEGPVVTLEINGQIVNRATACETAPGKILLTAEGSAIEFRNVQLRTIDKP